MKKNVWTKPELKSLIKPIETVFIWNSGQPDRKPWEEAVTYEKTVFLTRVKNLFFGKNKLIA